MKILTYILMTASLLLTACQGAATPATQATLTGGLNNAAPKPTSQAQSAYPPPGAAAGGYPAQAGSTATENPPAAQAANSGPTPAATEQNTPGSSYPPQPGDQDMSQGKFFVDSATLQPNPAHQDWTDLMVTGSLPTPCNLPRVQLNPPDNQNKIVVNAYSVIPKDKICNQMIQPFTGRIAILGGYPSGKYTVVVNDKTAGELTVP